MSLQFFLKKIISSLLKSFLSVPEMVLKSIGTPKKVLIVRQHNQFGDLLASVSLFRAVKETFPHSHLTLIASRENYFAVLKNECIDELFIFDKKKLWNIRYLSELKKTLRRNYDLAIVPATVAISATSCLLARLSDAKIKIGPKQLNGKTNLYAYVFHHQINLDWRKYPDAHVSDFILDIVRPFGIKTKNFNPGISFDNIDLKTANEFIASFLPQNFELLIGLHIGAGKPQNRWPLKNFVELIERIKSIYNIKLYFTGSNADFAEIEYMKNYCNSECGYFLNRTVPQLAALISRSNFFITNDTGVMHVAGTTSTPQISIFGPTNPFNWAPVGAAKYFIRKSEIISDVSVDDVFNLFQYILEKHAGTNEKK
ncbi:MAG: glycosyltransferase family 9 protein [Bacteroidota bacterium]